MHADESVEREVGKHSSDDDVYFGTMNSEFSIYTIPATNDTKTNGSIFHQNIFVVDGRLAFKGSTNLTLSGRRKAAEDLDPIEMLTDVEEVAGLNDRFFSLVMARMRLARRIEKGDYTSVLECV